MALLSIKLGHIYLKIRLVITTQAIKMANEFNLGVVAQTLIPTLRSLRHLDL